MTNSIEEMNKEKIAIETTKKMRKMMRKKKRERRRTRKKTEKTSR